MDWEAEARFLAAHPGRTIYVARTLRERLFSRPWRPWKATQAWFDDPYALRRLNLFWHRVQVQLAPLRNARCEEWAALERSLGIVGFET